MHRRDSLVAENAGDRETSAGRALGPRGLAMGGALTGGLALLIVTLAPALPDPPAGRAAWAFSFFILSLPPLLLALPDWLAGARRAAAGKRARWLFGAAILAAMLLERLARDSTTGLLGLTLYAALPLLLTADRPRSSGPLLRDLPLVLLLWLPVELRWVTGDFVLLRLLGLDLLLLLYVVERPLWEPGRLLPLRAAEVQWGMGAYAGFLLLAVPIALATGFAAPGVAERSAGDWALLLVSTFWVIALPEEALFRGVIQGLLQKVLRNGWWALALASLIFGLSHLNNSTNVEAPDWRYVLLASLAGAAYGLAYIKTRNLAAPTLTHFLVDITWRGFFAGPT